MTTLLERLGLRRQAREQEKSAGLAEYYKLLRECTVPRGDGEQRGDRDAARLEELMELLGLREEDVRRDLGILTRAAALAETADQAAEARAEHERVAAAAAKAVEGVKKAEEAAQEAAHQSRLAGGRLSEVLTAERDLAGLRQAHPELLG